MKIKVTVTEARRIREALETLHAHYISLVRNGPSIKIQKKWLRRWEKQRDHTWKLSKQIEKYIQEEEIRQSEARIRRSLNKPYGKRSLAH